MTANDLQTLSGFALFFLGVFLFYGVDTLHRCGGVIRLFAWILLIVSCFLCVIGAAMFLPDVLKSFQ